MLNENLTNILKRLDKLEGVVFGSSKVSDKAKRVTKFDGQDITFSINKRAFVKRYAANKSGPKKFTLILAYLANGETQKNVALSEIKNNWGKMSAKNMLGKFNMFYPSDARTRGWIDSKKHGLYNLTDEWKNIL